MAVTRMQTLSTACTYNVGIFYSGEVWSGLNIRD